MSQWEPIRPPQVLGELMDSRYMMPLLFPSDPRLLSAVPGKKAIFEDHKRVSIQSLNSRSEVTSIYGSTSSAPMPWVSRNRKIRKVDAGTLQWVDGIRSASRWGRPVAPDYEPEDENKPSQPNLVEDGQDPDPTVNVNPTPLTRKPSGRAKTRPSMGDTTPIEGSFEPHHNSNLSHQDR